MAVVWMRGVVTTASRTLIPHASNVRHRHALERVELYWHIRKLTHLGEAPPVFGVSRSPSLKRKTAECLEQSIIDVVIDEAVVSGLVFC